jgi:OFA family oxalate/formate antiporter-like MFS transporter
MESLQNSVGISGMFIILGIVYFIMMFIGHLLLRKPSDWVEAKTNNDFSYSILKNKTFVGIWLIFYINIHCGLMLITYEKQFLNTRFAGLEVLAVIISVIPSVTAICNALGRIGYSTISDKLRDRSLIYVIIFISCIVVCGLSFGVINGVLVIILLMVVNLGYGGGFSTLPALLESRFGMKNISKIHGLTLSAWAIAGLTGNNLSEVILSNSENNYQYIIMTAGILYAVALVICLLLVYQRPGKAVKN